MRSSLFFVDFNQEILAFSWWISIICIFEIKNDLKLIFCLEWLYKYNNKQGIISASNALFRGCHWVFCCRIIGTGETILRNGERRLFKNVRRIKAHILYIQGGVSPVSSKCYFRWDEQESVSQICTSVSSVLWEGVSMKENTSDLKEQMYSWILAEMEQAEAAGLSVSVDGRPYTLAETERLHQVMEEAYYMKDYVGDRQGRITQIDFERLDHV